MSTSTGDIAVRRWPCRFKNVPPIRNRHRRPRRSGSPPRSPASSAPICRSGSSVTTAAVSARATRRPGSSSARRRRCATCSPGPGEIGFARAYVAGEIDVEGDIFEALALRENLPDVKVTPREWLALGAHRGRRRVAAAAAAAGGGAGARAPPQQGARRGRDRAPLRRVERLLPADPRSLDDVLVCRLRAARNHARSGAGRQVRARVPQARAPGRACACSTSAAVGAAW